MVHRALTHCSSWDAFHAEIVRIKCILQRNCYPIDFIDCIVRELLQRYFSGVAPERWDMSDFSFFLPLQYRGPHTQRFACGIRRLLPALFTYIYTRKLHTALKPAIEKIPILCQSNIVYCYTCGVCKNKYIGMSKWHLLTRVREHSKSDLFTHHSICANVCDFSACFSIIYKCVDVDTLRHCEAIHILSRKPRLNTQLAPDTTCSYFRLQWLSAHNYIFVCFSFIAYWCIHTTTSLYILDLDDDNLLSKHVESLIYYFVF
jgi:hypothetical protein